YRSGQGDQGHDLVQKIPGFLSRSYTRDETPTSLQVIGHFVGGHGDRCIKVGEYNDQDRKQYVVGQTENICKLHFHPLPNGRGVEGPAQQGGREHDRLCKNDAHYTGSVQLQGNVLSCTHDILFITSRSGSSCILYGNLPYGHNQEYGSQDDQ